MVANHLRFDVRGINIEVLAQVIAKSLAVEIRAGAQHRRAVARLACDIGERVVIFNTGSGIKYLDCYDA